MLWDLFQEHRIGMARAEASQAQSTVRAVDMNLRELQTRVEILERSMNRAELVLMAATELLRENLGVSDVELADRVAEIDLRDGVQDGRITRGPCACPQCGRSNQTSRRDRCMYCGTALPVPGV